MSRTYTKLEAIPASLRSSEQGNKAIERNVIASFQVAESLDSKVTSALGSTCCGFMSEGAARDVSLQFYATAIAKSQQVNGSLAPAATGAGRAERANEVKIYEAVQRHRCDMLTLKHTDAHTA